MKELDMLKLQDITDTPSEDLKKNTLAAMAAVAEKRERRKKPVWKRVGLCAAMFCGALMLMGMGVRVFEYLTYVPGMGIVTADQEEVYSLKEVVDMGEFRIEAASMIPADEEYYKGQWQVTVLTDKELQVTGDEIFDVEPMILTAGGEEYALTYTGGSGMGARFAGYAVIDGAGEYHVTWGGDTVSLAMESMENSVWANYQYPVSEGITVIAFPLAEGSQYMVFDVMIDPQSKNMEYWASHAMTVRYYPKNLMVTDVEGNEYLAVGSTGHGTSIPASERAHGINGLLQYRMEHIIHLDRALTAEIATIEMDSVVLLFHNLSGLEEYTLTIPQLDEVITAENLPKDGLMFDSHGIRQVLREVTVSVDELNNTYSLRIPADNVEFDFEENAVSAQVRFSYLIPGKYSFDHKPYLLNGGKSGHTEDGGKTWNFVHDMAILGPGDLKSKGHQCPFTFGDEVIMSIGELTLTIDGNWYIDFTQTAEDMAK